MRAGIFFKPRPHPIPLPWGEGAGENARMNVQRFLTHYGLTANPFEAEEARQDLLFVQCMEQVPPHPDFNKILGQIDPPSTSIVLGEKGSGKTAIRMMLGRRIAEHNAANPQSQVLQ